MKVKFMHIRNQQNNPIATVAMEKEGDNYRLGLAICSKKDQFTKRKGRVIARGRLSSRNGQALVTDSPKLLAYHTLESILQVRDDLGNKKTKRRAIQGMKYLSRLLDVQNVKHD